MSLQVLNRDALRDLAQFTMQLAVKLGVPYVVAPFEADQQLAVLAALNVVGAR